MNTFEQIDETKLRVRIADVKPDSDDVKLCVDIIDMGAYKCKRFDAAMIKPDEAITDVPVVNAGLVDLTLKLLLVSIPGLIWFLDIRCGFKDLLIVHMAGKLELSLLTEVLDKNIFYYISNYSNSGSLCHFVSIRCNGEISVSIRYRQYNH